MAISQAQIDEVIKRADIVEIIGKYIDVHKKGRSYVAVCPFHDDSSPSLSISQEKKVFKCFPCGVSGNAIMFVQQFKNINFFKAVKEIADYYNIKLDGYVETKEKSKYNNLQEKILKINKESSEYFLLMLDGELGVEARKYLASRNITDFEKEKFKIGFAPSNNELYNYLIDLKFTDEEILASGLFYEQGIKKNHFFFNRIIFPISDDESNIIGFSGRAIDNETNPKYKNSSENLVFKKSQLAYNFDRAKKYIRSSNSLIILEGFMDVIALEKIGINNSIAIMGTSISQYHLKLFASYTKKIKLFLDGDDPGIQAAIKVSKLLLENNFETTIVENNSLKDPDELIKGGDSKTIPKMLEEAKHPIDFAINYYFSKLNKDDSYAINKFIDNIVEIIKSEKNESIISLSINKLVQLTGIDKDGIVKKIGTKNTTHNNQVINKKITAEDAYKNYETYYEHFEPDLDYKMSDDNGFLIHTVDIEKVVTKKNNKNKLRNEYNNSVSISMKFRYVECLLLNQLTKNKKYFGEIKNIINDFNFYDIKKLAKIIIDKYDGVDEESFNANDLEKYIESLSENYHETFLDIKNSSSTSTDVFFSEQLFDDIKDVLEEYKILNEINHSEKKLRELNFLRDSLLKEADKEIDDANKDKLKKESNAIYQTCLKQAEYIETLRKKVNKILVNKRRK